MKSKRYRSAVLLMLLSLSLLLGACAQGEVGVVVNRDGTADIHMNATISESALNTIGQGDLPEKIASSLREQGLDAQAVSADGQSGLSASRKVDLQSGRMPELPDGITMQNTQEEGLFTTTHHLVVTANPPQILPESSSLTGYIGSRIVNRLIEREFDFNFKLTLPIKPGENNADEVSSDGKTLTWHLAATSENVIELTFAVPNVRRIVYAASAVLVVVIALIVFLLMRRKRRKAAAAKQAEPKLPSDRV
ncbi:hypothetical protein QWJ34_01540 [Saccharibacillus sp. CPCC 101409]|uniref:hypothetical protein n=1 Tax=Saccharibacillus sp. CPCC 101409 TaxID=3058041 RepID=UPI002671068E|nr:hypothetical protein [Saccharibacillus sp. CPCC 101409]MDO3408442.1 hypothetical protein [Saccharibacillus sp. CPCC 101409]